jgi:hypothetical protein
MTRSAGHAGIIDLTTPCWRWPLNHDKDGYARLGTERLHRVMYELLKYQLGPGQEPDHLCGVRDCINPMHMEAVTMQENRKRASVNGRKTHCKFGHPFAGDNLAMTPDGRRRCRACNREWQRRFKAARKVVAS